MLDIRRWLRTICVIMRVTSPTFGIFAYCKSQSSSLSIKARAAGKSNDITRPLPRALNGAPSTHVAR